MSSTSVTQNSFAQAATDRISDAGALKIWVYRLGLVVLFLIPIRLSFTYIVLLPMLGLWVYSYSSELRAIASEVKRWAAPFYLFVFISILSGLFALEPLSSAFHLMRLAVVFTVAVMFWTIASGNRFLELSTALLTGQLVSSLHSVFEAAFPELIPPFFHGAVSESGQLAITVVFALGLAISLLGARDWIGSVRPYREMAVGTIVAGSVGASSWLQFPMVAKVILAVVCLGYLIVQIQRIRSVCGAHGERVALSLFLTAVILPFLLAALVVNLKRGPWAGVTCGISVLLLFHNRKLLLPFLTAAVLVVFSFKPVAARILDMPAHFFMSGGRGTIWDIGLELAIRFPLGIGFDNSGVLRQFSLDVPDFLNHFHSNFLNILVETGWPGFALFLWWIVAVVRCAFAACPFSVVSTTVLAVIVSWQVAGLAEYNFGDSEVLLVVLVVLGILLRKSALRSTSDPIEP